VYWPVGPTRSEFVIHLLTRVDAKTRVFWGRPQNEPCAPYVPVHSSWVMCGTSITPDSGDSNLGKFIFFKIC